MTLHFSQITFTLGCTFIGRPISLPAVAGPALFLLPLAPPAVLPSAGRAEAWPLLVAVGDAPTGQVVGGDLDLDPVTGEDADPVHAHLP